MTCKIFKKNNESGYSLLELIIALAIGSVVGLLITLVSVRGLSLLKDTRGFERLQSNSIFLTDTISFWIKQAQTVSVSGDTLTISLPDGSLHVISISADNELLLDGGVLTSADIEVADLELTHLDKSVRVELELAQRNGPRSISVATTVAQRN